MKRTTLLSAATPLAVAAAAILAVGDLNPPAGAVAATGKRLTEIEPRIPLSATTTPGDADSLFKITQRGSYYLTGNLDGVVGKSGIEIAASSVSIDLGGFNVDGSVVGSTLDGIRTSVVAQNIRIANGSLTNWSGDGIDLQTNIVVNGSVERVDVSFTSGTSFRLGTNFASDRCTARSGSVGFLGGEGCTLTSCTAFDMVGSGFGNGIAWTLDKCVANDCAAAGFTGFGSSTFTDCVARRCDGGFSLNGGNTLSGCVANLSIGGRNGIQVTFDCLIRDCVANDNAGSGIVASYSSILGCTTNLNAINGITATAACIVLGNTCSSNGTGIVVNGVDNRLEGNNCTQNSALGIDVNFAGNIIVRNTCSGSLGLNNWDIVANNVLGPILDRRAPASAAVLGHSAASSLGSTDPNANFTY